MDHVGRVATLNLLLFLAVSPLLCLPSLPSIFVLFFLLLASFLDFSLFLSLSLLSSFLFVLSFSFLSSFLSVFLQYLVPRPSCFFANHCGQCTAFLRKPFEGNLMHAPACWRVPHTPWLGHASSRALYLFSGWRGLVVGGFVYFAKARRADTEIFDLKVGQCGSPHRVQRVWQMQMYVGTRKLRSSTRYKFQDQGYISLPCQVNNHCFSSLKCLVLSS